MIGRSTFLRILAGLVPAHHPPVGLRGDQFIALRRWYSLAHPRIQAYRTT